MQRRSHAYRPMQDARRPKYRPTDSGQHQARFQKIRLKPTPVPDTRAFVPTSIVLQRLHDEAPADHFTLAWLMGSLGRRSFGIIMLLLGLVAP